MGWGRIGGVLVVGGSALCLPAAALYGPAEPGDTGLRDLGNLVLNASLALLGCGTAVLAIAGSRPLDGRNVRIGLATLATGLLGMLVSSIIPIPAGSNSLQSWPYIISAAIGVLATAIGTLVTVLSLARAPGQSQRVAGLFLAGLLLVVVFSLLANGAIDLGPLQAIAELLAALGGVAIVLSVATLGVLAIRGDRSAPDASAWTTESER